MAVCKKCGGKIDSKNIVCLACGTSVADTVNMPPYNADFDSKIEDETNEESDILNQMFDSILDDKYKLNKQIDDYEQELEEEEKNKKNWNNVQKEIINTAKKSNELADDEDERFDEILKDKQDSNNDEPNKDKPNKDKHLMGVDNDDDDDDSGIDDSIEQDDGELTKLFASVDFSPIEKYEEDINEDNIDAIVEGLQLDKYKLNDTDEYISEDNSSKDKDAEKDNKESGDENENNKKKRKSRKGKLFGRNRKKPTSAVINAEEATKAAEVNEVTDDVIEKLLSVDSNVESKPKKKNKKKVKTDVVVDDEIPTDAIEQLLSSVGEENDGLIGDDSDSDKEKASKENIKDEDSSKKKEKNESKEELSADDMNAILLGEYDDSSDIMGFFDNSIGESDKKKDDSDKKDKDDKKDEIENKSALDEEFSDVFEDKYEKYLHGNPLMEKIKGTADKVFGNVEDEKYAKKEEAYEQASKAKKKLKQQKEINKKAAKAKKKEDSKAAKAASKEEKKKQKLEEAAKKRRRKEARKKALIAEAANEPKTRINKLGATIVFIFFTLVAVVVIVYTMNYSYNSAVRKANDYYNREQYDKAYEELAGMKSKLKDEDKKLYDKLRIIQTVNNQISISASYKELENKTESLNHLIIAVTKYDENISQAKELNIDKRLDIVFEEAKTSLEKDYSLDLDEAREISKIADKTVYTDKLNELCR